MNDLRYAIRTLLRAPGFAVVAVLTLALGIGANTAMFSLVHAVLLRPLPVHDAAQLVSIFTTDARNPGNLPMSHLNFLDLRAQNEAFSDVAAFTFAAMDFDAGRGAPEPVDVQVVTGNYFDVLGVQPAWGRGFLADEDRTPGSHPVAVLGYGFWQRQFGGLPMTGRTITLNRTAFTVVGVAPRDFNGVFVFGETDVWVPAMMHAVAQPGFDFWDTRRGLFLFPFGRLKPGITRPQAQASLQTLAARLEAAYPNDNRGRGVATLPLLTARVNPDGAGELAQLSTLLMGVVGTVLLIACANLANLLLARATGR